MHYTSYKTRETNQLTQKAVNNIVEDSTLLVRNTVERVKKGVEMCLDDAGISLDSIPGLEQLFTDDHPISNPFQHVSTKHKQEAYFKVNFGLVVSSPCVIATGISLGFSFQYTFAQASLL